MENSDRKLEYTFTTKLGSVRVNYYGTIYCECGDIVPHFLSKQCTCYQEGEK